MLELGHKERQLLSGIGVQIALVMVMVFVYTQAMRQVKLQRERLTRLQEQVTVAREELAKLAVARAAPSRVEEELTELKASWVAPEGIPLQVGELEKLIREGHGLSNFRVKVGREPSDQWQVPLDGGPPLEFQLYPLEIAGFGTTRSIGEILAHLADPATKPARILVDLELKSAGGSRPEPVRFSAEYLIPVMTGAGAPGGILPAPESPKLAWGPREEPFLSPLEVGSALRQAADKLKDLRLTGILREGESATCVINDQILKPGDRIQEHQVVLITEDAVLLRNFRTVSGLVLEEEVLLRL